MNPHIQSMIASAKSNRRTAAFCRQRALNEEATKCAELAEKWWGYYRQYRDMAVDNIKSARRALA